MSQLSSKNPLAAGVGGLPALSSAFAATQAAWRFYANDAVTPAQLAAPLIEHVDQAARQSCQGHVLLPCDWSFLSYAHHGSKADRTQYSTALGEAAQAQGYELFSVLALSDTGGQPLGPVALQVRHAQGVDGTFGPGRQESCFRLDRLVPALRHVAGLKLGGKTPVFMIDREADSVLHLRQWSQDGHRFVVRANAQRYLLHEGAEQRIAQVVEELHQGQSFTEVGPVEIKSRWGMQQVAQTPVTLHRPACQNRVSVKGGIRKKRHKYVPGPRLTLRLVVSEVRDAAGKLLARWLLLTNLEDQVPPRVVARWYYWRWRIETYHKLLKSAGVQVEHWRQECAPGVLKRLLVCAMSVTLMWQLAREQAPQAEELRGLLVRLSGRQMARGTKNKPGRQFTEPALLAGLGILLPMLALMEHTELDVLRELVAQFFGRSPRCDNSA
jgi:hypothetical protein